MIGRATSVSCLLRKFEIPRLAAKSPCNTTLSKTAAIVNQPTYCCFLKQTQVWMRLCSPAGRQSLYTVASYVYAKGASALKKLLLASFLISASPLAPQLSAQQAAQLSPPQDASAETVTLRLWEGKAPGALGDSE